MKESKLCVLMAKFKQMDADATTEKNELMTKNKVIKEELKACQEKNIVLETELKEENISSDKERIKRIHLFSQQWSLVNL